MEEIRQGEILRLEHPAMNILVLSRDIFNRTGFVIACPVAARTTPDALHISVSTRDFSGTAMLEQLRSLDIQARYYKRVAMLPFEQVQEISDAVQSIFEYYPFSL